MLNHLELFAGIGGFRQAIELLGKDFSIKNNCIGFSEIDPYATKTYKANFNTENEVEIGDIVKFTSAYAAWIAKNAKNQRIKIVVGRDARISGEMVNNTDSIINCNW